MKKKKFIKNLLLIIIFIILVIIFVITKPTKEKEVTLDDKLINIGYTQSDITTLQNDNIKKLLLKYEYNKNYILIINNENFQSDKL